MSTGPKRLGKYELQEILGHGGMAEVWKGFDPQLKRYVAIKFLHTNLRSDPDFMNRFLREGQAIAALRHPNIVQVYDFQVGAPGDEGPTAYMVMDYIEGSTLADYLRRTSYARKFPSAEEIVRLFTSISLAVDYAHRQRMVHRDIKPANILLDTRNTLHNPMGEPILTDFGIVKMMGTATLTSTGMSMGTPIYISPEQVQGQPGNERSDIYSLGVMLYEMCTGEPPYRGDSPYVIMAQHVNSTPMPPSQRNPNVPMALDAVILRSLARNPQARFPSAAAMTVALAEAIDVPIPDQVRHSIASLHVEEQHGGSTGNPPSNPGVVARGTNPPSNPGALVRGAHPPSNPGASSRGISLSGIPDGEETFRATNDVISAEDIATVLSDGNVSAAYAPTHGGDEQRGVTPPIGNQPMTPPAQYATPRSKGPVTPRPHSEFPADLPISPLPQSGPKPQGPRERRRNPLLLIGIVALLLVLLGAGVGTYFLVRTPATTGAAASTNIVGSAGFVSSGLVGNAGIPGINDGIQIHLQHVPDPSPGNQYYAWLQDSQVETKSTPLGILKVNQGIATLSYNDSQHTDLLMTMSKFLVTEEPVTPTPNNPALDKKQWRYSAALPQTPSPTDPEHFSYLDHVRHLLSNEPALDRLNLKGGVDYWFLYNTQEMQKNSMEARDHNNPQEIRQLVTNILFYLDGQCAKQELANAGSNLGPENSGIAHNTTVSLLDCPLLQEPPGHLTHVGNHLRGIANAPGVAPQQVSRAIQINKDLNNIKAWLVQVRTDALQLVAMDDTHLLQALPLRTELATQAGYVLGGRVDPATQTLEPSIGQICNNITLLASFDVAPYKA